MSTIVKIVKSKDGTEVYAEATGDSTKPAVVFVHGFACAGTAFDPLFAVKSLLEHVYCVRYDARGHARSGKPETAEFYESDRYAQDFQAVVDAFSLDKPFYAGWSLGGAISADITAAKIPISGLIYLGALPYLGDILPIVATPLVLSFLPGLTAPETPAIALSTRIDFARTIVAAGFVVPFADLCSWVGAAAHMPPAAATLLLGRTQDSAPLKQAGADGLPLCIIHGDSDLQVSGKAVIEQMQPLFKDCEVTLLPGVGHIPFYEAPEATAAAVVKFVERVLNEKKN